MSIREIKARLRPGNASGKEYHEALAALMQLPKGLQSKLLEAV